MATDKLVDFDHVKDYISRAEAIKILCGPCFCKRACDAGIEPVCSYYINLFQIPAADVVGVVRCRDCENWDKSWLPNGDKSGNSHFCPMIDLTTDGDFFCSFGERRSDQNAG